MMKLYDITETPLKIYGLAVADSEKRQFFKLSEEALERFPQYGYLGRRAAGGRVRFQTDAKKLYVKMTLAGTKEDINIPLSGSAGADIDLKKRCMGLRQMLRTRRIVIIIHDKETHLGKSRKIFREILFAPCAAGKTHVTVVRIQPSADDTGVSIAGSGCASTLCNRGTVKYDRRLHGIRGCFP